MLNEQAMKSGTQSKQSIPYNQRENSITKSVGKKIFDKWQWINTSLAEFWAEMFTV